MFLKLCKHELKCSYRSFLFLYAVLLLASLFFNPNGSNMLTTIVMLIYLIILFVLFVMCILVIIKNYSNSMFSRNSYLTHTLPVSTTELLLTKILSAAFWSVISILVVILSSILMVFRFSGFDISLMGEALSELFSSPYLMDGVMYILYALFSMIQVVTLIYLVMNITHTTHIQRFRPAIAFILYILIEWIMSFLVNRILGIFHIANFSIFSFETGIYGSEMPFVTDSTNFIFILLVTSIVITTIYFFASKYILDHKLEIE